MKIPEPIEAAHLKKGEVYVLRFAQIPNEEQRQQLQQFAVEHGFTFLILGKDVTLEVAP